MQSKKARDTVTMQVGGHIGLPCFVSHESRPCSLCDFRRGLPLWGCDSSFVHRLGTRRLLSQRHRNGHPGAFGFFLQDSPHLSTMCPRGDFSQMETETDATRTEKKLQTTRMPKPSGKRLMLLQGASTGTEQELQQVRAGPGNAGVLHVEGMAKREALPTGTLSVMCGVLEGRTLHAGDTR